MFYGKMEKIVQKYHQIHLFNMFSEWRIIFFGISVCA